MPAPGRISRGLTLISLCVGLSILYQVYAYDFNEGTISGGEIQRFALKAIAAVAFFVSVRSYLSIRVLSLNLFLKIPLFFIAISILAMAPFLTSDYAQSLNLIFYLPLLLIDWNRPGAAELYRRTWKCIAWIVWIQLVLDPLFKARFLVTWKNGAVIGGMGNPNVFGIYLIAAGLASAMLLNSRLRYVSTILFLATVLTGSLVSTLVGFSCACIQAAFLMARAPSRSLLIGATVFVLLSASTVALDFVSDSHPINHAMGKFLQTVDLLTGRGGEYSGSISGRLDYTRTGLEMVNESPLGLLTGHPDGVVMYDGDGMWIGMLVTYGLPATLYFLLTNVVVIWRAMGSSSRDLLFSGCVVAVTMAFLVTNRILDYWPVGLIYLLAFSYLTTRGVRRLKRAHEAVQAASLSAHI